MSGPKKKIADFMALEPKNFCFLKCIELSRVIDAEGVSLYNIKVVMMSDDYLHEMRYEFMNAFGIKIGSLEGLLYLLIRIYDVVNHQIEGGVYRVSDEEQYAFSFYCEDFLVTPVSAVG
jgi:hypothetical protein